MPVNYGHIVLASLGGIVTYFVCGSILFVALPAMKAEFLKYPNVYRSQDAMMKVMPYNMVGILISIAIAAVLYAKIYTTGGGIVASVYFGVLVGIFAVCTYAIHNYAMLNTGLALMLYEGITYFVQWVAVGAAIGLVYKA